MAENNCPPYYNHPTNQYNYQISNNIVVPQQQVIAVDNGTGITQLGFDQFYPHGQDQQQQQQQRRLLVNHQQINKPSHSFGVNFGGGLNGDYGKIRGGFGEEEDGGILYLCGSEQFGMAGSSSNLTRPNCWRNQGDPPVISAPPIGRPLLTEYSNEHKRCNFEILEEIKEVRDQNQNKRPKHTEELRNVLEDCRQVGNVEANYEGNSSIVKNNEMSQESAHDQLKAIISVDEKAENSASVMNEKDPASQTESPVVGYVNSLFEQMMGRQESLHQSLLETVERLDKQRTEREEEWKKQKLARLNQKANDEANARALASRRENLILSYLENISRQCNMIPINNTIENLTNDVMSSAEALNVNKRWPKIEVEALIKVRTNLEPKFHDLALKAYVWEEISRIMGTMGYRRSAQRCKEKWENINRYYKKAKEQNPQKRKNCPYFKQLDQFYSSKPFTNVSSSSSSPISSMNQERKYDPFEEFREKNEDEEEEGSDRD